MASVQDDVDGEGAPCVGPNAERPADIELPPVPEGLFCLGTLVIEPPPTPRSRDGNFVLASGCVSVIAGGGPGHSVAHSGDLIAVAVAGPPVGVDVEQADGRPHLLGGDGDPEALALVYASERSDPRALTWGELSGRVAVAAAGLRALVVARGDRVAAYMPNIPETVIAFLAVSSIGAIWSSAAPEFGARSVIDRFAQI